MVLGTKGRGTVGTKGEGHCGNIVFCSCPGILLCEVATGEKPYADAPCPIFLTIKVIMGHRPTLACNVPSPYQKLAVECWNGDLNMRPTFRYALGELNKLYAETNPVQLYTENQPSTAVHK